MLRVFFWFSITNRLPYDWKNPTGYLITVSMQWFLASWIFQYIGCMVFLGFASFIIAISVIKILNGELHPINKMSSDKISRKSRQNLYEKFFKFIYTHANSKQLSAWKVVLISWYLVVFEIRYWGDSPPGGDKLSRDLAKLCGDFFIWTFYTAIDKFLRFIKKCANLLRLISCKLLRFFLFSLRLNLSAYIAKIE